MSSVKRKINGDSDIVVAGEASVRALVDAELDRAISENRDFSFSVSLKKKFISAVGVPTLVQILLESLRSRNVDVIGTPPRAELPALVRRVLGEAERLERPNVRWSYKFGESGQDIIVSDSMLLCTSSPGQMLSTALSGEERYRSRIVAKTPTPSENWRNDAMLRKAITHNCTDMPYLETEALSRGRLRVFCMQGNGCHYPTSFPISIVVWLLRREAKLRPTGVIGSFLDPCAGWGDRLAGAMISGKKCCERYIGIDPWETSHKVCEKIRNLLETEDSCTVSLLRGTAQNGANWPDVDLVFTSPPYADLECYNLDDGHKEDGQAWRLVETETFVSGFLKPMIENAARATKAKNGRVIINLGNIAKKKSRYSKLTEFLVKTAKSAGMRLVETFGMSLSVRAPKTSSEHGSEVYRGEPFFIFVHQTQQ